MNRNYELNDTWLQDSLINLKLDTKLKLSNDNISSELQKTELQLSNIEKLNSAAKYPTPYIFAKFASKAYDDVENKNDMPSGWKLLTTASNDLNSYFGAAYLNSEKHQIVIAHRGTDPSHWKDILTDIRGIILNKYVTQMNSAITFAHKISTAIKELELDYFQLFFTGHSLGGWLAQITALTTKYPYLVNNTVQHCRLVQQNVHQEEEYHAHTVVFDSSGCEQMLLKIADEFSLRYTIKTSIDVYSLDITSYLSAPNRINTFNRHVGKIYRIITNISEEEEEEEDNTDNNSNILQNITKYSYKIKNWFEYNKKAHSIIKIIEALDDSSTYQLYDVLDWPFCTLSNRQEYNDFFKFIQDYKLNNYHVDENHESSCTIRYKTKNFKENECSINVFTQNEQNFLKIYQILRSEEKFFQPNSLFDSIGDNEKSKAQEILKSFEIKDVIARFETVEKLNIFIPYVKLLFKLFPSVKAETVKQSFDYDIYRKFFQLESNQFISTFNFDFKDKSNLEISLVDFLNDNNIKAWKIEVEKDIDTSISLAIVNKLLETIKSEFSIVAISLERLLNVNQEISLKNFFDFNKFFNYVLLVESKPNKNINYSKVKDLFKNLISCLNNKSKSIKIVLVSQDNDYLDEECKEIFSVSYKKTKYEGVKWNDLTSESQNKILEKKVSFQGNSIDLKELVGTIEKELNELFDTKTLYKLFNNELIKIGNELLFDDSLYISRCLNYQTRIKKEVFTKIKDMFVISDDNTKNLSNNTNCIIVSNDEQALSELNKFPEIHWLKYEPNTGSYIWQRSKGNLSELRKYIDNTKYQVNDWINEVSKSKTVIISDTAGMGKSTFLNYVYQSIKESSNSSWLIRLNLNDYTIKLKELILVGTTIHNDNGTELSFDFDAVIDFLSYKLLLFETKFEQELFKLNIKLGKVIIMFDGFDEISPSYKQNVINLLRALKENENQLWVTTRPNMQEVLEDNLNQFAFKLEPFSRQDQINYLKNYWMNRLNIFNCDSTKLKAYAEALLDNLEKSINNDKELTGIPLQMRMLAEVFENDCNKFYKTGQLKPELDARLDLIDLYEKFLNNKYEINFYEKIKFESSNTQMKEEIIPSIIKKYETEYQLMALYVIIDKEDAKLLINKEQGQIIQGFLKDFKNGGKNIGIIDQIVEDKPQFMHRTFAEYLTATYVINCLQNKQSTETFKKLLVFLIEKILKESNYRNY